MERSFISDCFEKRYDKYYEELEKIGRGGFASVYKVRYKYDDHIYAVKKIKMRVKDVKGNFEEEVQKVLREAKHLAKINHPNVIRYYNSWVEGVRVDSGGKKKGKDQKKDDNPSNNGSKKMISPLNQLKPQKPSKPTWEADEDDALENFNLEQDSYDEIQFEAYPDDQGEEKTIGAPSKEAMPSSPNRSTASSNTVPEDLKHVIVYLQIELCAQTLEQYLQTRNKKLDELKKKPGDAYEIELFRCLEEAKMITGQILDGLQSIHNTYKLIHRDLKPSNIFLTDTLQVKIGDLGLVKKLECMQPMMPSPILGPLPAPGASSFISEMNPLAANSELDGEEFVMTLEEPRLSEEHALSYSPQSRPAATLLAPQPAGAFDSITKSIGTPTYSSPEQLTGNAQTFDQRSDIWSLGLVLIQLFLPMNTVMEQMKILKKAREGSYPDKLLELNPALHALLPKLLNNEPSSRPEIPAIREMLLQSSDLGTFEIRMENKLKWKRRQLRLRDKKLYCYTEGETKADACYLLSECACKLDANGDITLLHPLTLGLQIKNEGSSKKIYQILSQFTRSS